MAQGDSQERALTVSQALLTAKQALEGFVVTVEGEVSEFSNKAGYKAVYFTVKDANASMPCMMWANRFAQAGVQVHVGSLVRLTGRFTLYAAKGRMNFDVFSIRLAGEGELRQRVADLAKKLEAEGLMDPQTKRPVPRYMEVIGVVTSPRGAAVHDVLRTLRRRFPVARILLAGVPVEGKDASRHLMEGLRTVAAAGAEAVLLVRGGGSFEDFMPFNDEQLARCIASLPVPVVTGIGHEPDTCIADMVADLRASTPTAAAEAVSPKRENLATGFDNAARRLGTAMGKTLDGCRVPLQLISQKPLFKDGTALFGADALKLDALSDSLYRSIPQNIRRDEAQLSVLSARMEALGPAMLTEVRGKADTFQMRLTAAGKGLLPETMGRADALATRMCHAGKTFLSPHRAESAVLASRLNDLSPLTILSRGYSVAYGQDGSVLRSVSQVSSGQHMTVNLADGMVGCAVESVEKVQREPVELS